MLLMFRVWIFFLQNQVLFSFQRKYIFQDHLLCILKHKKKICLPKKKQLKYFRIILFSTLWWFGLLHFWTLFLWEFWFSLYVFSLCCVWLYGNISRYTCPCPCMWRVEDDFVFLPLFLLPYSPTTGPGAHGWS